MKTTRTLLIAALLVAWAAHLTSLDATKDRVRAQMEKME